MGALATAPGDVTHVIQTALAPIFLLSGIGTLLNMFNLRLGRISDHYAHISELLLAATDDEEKAVGLYTHLLRLRRRRFAMHLAVIGGGLAGAFTCAAAFTLFLVALRDGTDSLLLLWMFGTALGLTVAALAAFIVDTALAWHGLRRDGPMPRSQAAQPA